MISCCERTSVIGDAAIHDDFGLTRFVIPGLTRKPVFSWIPASAGMTLCAMNYDAVCNDARMRRTVAFLLSISVPRNEIDKYHG